MSPTPAPAGGRHGPISYQLLIEVARPLRLRIGALGEFDFAAGRYTYTGSARRAFEARIARHLRAEKALRWHIDHLLTAAGVRVVTVRRSRLPECRLHQSSPGRVTVPGFGASDCRAGCGAHLKFLGSRACAGSVGR
jgi:Uri superfamily endonuclease